MSSCLNFALFCSVLCSHHSLLRLRYSLFLYLHHSLSGDSNSSLKTKPFLPTVIQKHNATHMVKIVVPRYTRTATNSASGIAMPIMAKDFVNITIHPALLLLHLESRRGSLHGCQQRSLLLLLATTVK